jgi:hypothetical protein
MVGSIAAVVASPVMAFVKDAYGWEALFALVAGLFLVAALYWLVIDCTRRVVTES